MKNYQQRLDRISDRLNDSVPLAEFTDEELEGVIQLLREKYGAKDQEVNGPIEINGRYYTSERDIPMSELIRALMPLVEEWRAMQK